MADGSDVGQGFDRSAADYDDLLRRNRGGAERLVASLPPGRYERVLDVGCGTDSSYLANAIGKGWLDGWQRKGWRTASRQPVANRDLWERMITELARHHRVRPVLVPGHAGHPQTSGPTSSPRTRPRTPSRGRTSRRLPTGSSGSTS